MKEKMTLKINPEKPSKYFDQKSYDMAKSRGKILSNLFDKLPIEYDESFERVSRFIIYEDAKPYGKDWPKYFKTVKDFQLYANLNPEWVGESIENLTAKFGDMSKGFYHFNLALDIFINKETKGFTNHETENAKKNIRHTTTQKIELINKSKEISSLQSIITTAEIPQARIQSESTTIQTEENLPANEKMINMSLDLLSRVRKSIPETQRKQFDSKVFDIISE